VAFMLCNFQISWLKFLHYCNEDIIVYNVHIDVVSINFIPFFPFSLIGRCHGPGSCSSILRVALQRHLR
jgi:hypothetical protein